MNKRIFLTNLLLASAMVVATPSCSDDDSNDEQGKGNNQNPTTQTIDGVTVSGTVGDYTYVDLGLSVKWATYNVGATKPTEYGDYFAWGETKPKEDYSDINFSTYKWTADGGKTFTKYVGDNDHGTVDNKTVLEPADDAATANWGSAWRMPTKDEIVELRKGCSWKWVEDFNGSGVNGQLGTSKANGNTIFLPAAGFRYDTALGSVGDIGYYWSSSLYGSFSRVAYFLYIYDDNFEWDHGDRNLGRSVRAVSRGKIYTVNFYTQDSTLIESQNVEEGKTASAVTAPTIAGYEFTGWSDSSFVKVTKDLNIYAKYEKNEAEDHGVTVSGTVGNYTYVDLGLSVKWATYNVGATKPTEYGDYFAWGETKPKEDYSWETYKWCNGSYDKLTKYCVSSSYGTVDNKRVLEAADDAATANWGSAWRMPTKDEIKELIKGCEWEWVADFKGSGVNGRLGTSKSNGNTIFLPAAGGRSGTDLHYVGDYGFYWSSSLLEYNSSYAYYLSFNDGIIDWYYDDYRSYGQSVRAVTK